MILLLLLWSKSENIRQTSEIEEVNSINDFICVETEKQTTKKTL